MYGYIKGRGHTHYGPGTSMTQFLPPGAGLGACESLGSLRTCCDSCAAGGSCGRGLTGCGCGGNCNKGMGLFESGLDFSQWSGVEWTLVGIGGYMLLSTLFTTQRAARRVGEGARRVRARAGKIKRGFTK